MKNIKVVPTHVTSSSFAGIGKLTEKIIEICNSNRLAKDFCTIRT